MAIVKNRGPIPRVRGANFGGSLSRGSKFSGYVSVNTTGLENAIEAVAEDNLEYVLKAVGDEVIAVSQPLVPVRTGELKASDFVTVSTSGGVSKVDYGYSANHAAPVEFGSGSRGPKPYLRPAHDLIVGSGRATERIREFLARKIEGK